MFKAEVLNFEKYPVFKILEQPCSYQQNEFASKVKGLKPFTSLVPATVGNIWFCLLHTTETNKISFVHSSLQLWRRIFEKDSVGSENTIASAISVGKIPDSNPPYERCCAIRHQTTDGSLKLALLDNVYRHVRGY